MPAPRRRLSPGSAGENSLSFFFFNLYLVVVFEPSCVFVKPADFCAWVNAENKPLGRVRGEDHRRGAWVEGELTLGGGLRAFPQPARLSGVLRVGLRCVSENLVSLNSRHRHSFCGSAEVGTAMVRVRQQQGNSSFSLGMRKKETGSDRSERW